MRGNLKTVDTFDTQLVTRRSQFWTPAHVSTTLKKSADRWESSQETTKRVNKMRSEEPVICNW